MERDPHETNPESPELYVGPGADELDDLDGGERPSWPKVIGVISIVWGAIGVVCGGAGIGWQLMAGSIMGNIPGGAPPAITNPNPMALGVGALGLLWSIVLIVAGSMTVARKPAGRSAHLLWAAIAIVLSIIGMYMQVTVQAEIAQWCVDNPSSDFAKQQAAGGAFGKYIGYACGGTLGFGWPIFILAWFGLVKRKPSDISQGVTELVA